MAEHIIEAWRCNFIHEMKKLNIFSTLSESVTQKNMPKAKTQPITTMGTIWYIDREQKLSAAGGSSSSFSA